MALPVANQGKTITTDNLYDFASRQVFEFDQTMLGLSQAIVATIEKEEEIEGALHYYGTCSTAAATTAKEVTITGYSLETNGFVVVKFTNAVPASATLNISSEGAKAIYHNGAAIAADVIGAGVTALFVYNGTNYDVVALSSASGGGGSVEALSNQEIDDIWDDVFHPSN